MQQSQYVCDRCGKAITSPVRVEVRSCRNPDSLVIRALYRSGSRFGFKDRDYCEECFKELKRCAGLKSEGSGDCGTEKGKE